MHEEVEWAKKQNETSEQKVFSMVAGEAFTTLSDLEKDFPNETLSARKWFEEEYPQYVKQPTK